MTERITEAANKYGKHQAHLPRRKTQGHAQKRPITPSVLRPFSFARSSGFACGRSTHHSSQLMTPKVRKNRAGSRDYWRQHACYLTDSSDRFIRFGVVLG
jgi:hypothetical protein